MPALSLRQRLLLSILAPLVVVFAISVFLDYRLARETADAAFDQSLVDAVLDIASHIQTDGLQPRVRLSAEAEAMLRSDPADQIFFAVRDQGGRLLAGDTDLPDVRATTDNQPEFSDRRFRGHWIRAAVQAIRAPHGDISITVAETLAKRNRASGKILTAMILPNVLVVLAAFLAVYLGVRKGLAPLEGVESEIAARSPRDLREIGTDQAPREIRPMIARLNELFGLLRDASAAQQRFITNAAHQLRTPLAGLQAQIELAAVAGSFAAEPERLMRIDEATGRVVHLVDQLLLYARADPTIAATQTFERVALAALTEKAASIFLDRALAKQIDLGFEIAPGFVTGIPWMLREALANLVDNALRYTPSQGVVTVRSGMRSGLAILEVEDNGPGISRDERERTFERFYRIPGSSSEGCGLGLAIVREIAELHGGRVELADQTGGGLRVTMLFPAAGIARTTVAATVGGFR